jgi:hypothetical protein
MRVFHESMLVASLKKKTSMLLSLLSVRRNLELLMLKIFDYSV